MGASHPMKRHSSLSPRNRKIWPRDGAKAATLLAKFSCFSGIRSKILVALICGSFLMPLSAAELYDEKRISHIEIIVDTRGEQMAIDPKPILSRMKTKEGDEFSQLTF